MLHLVQGDGFSAHLREARLKGEIVSWRDMMIEGPLANALRAPADWDLRAAVLAAHYGVDAPGYVREATERLRAIAAAAAKVECVLWFDEDLFGQANACYLIDWLSREAPEATTSIVLDAGGAPVGGLVELLAEREPLTPQRRILARAFWNALASADPSVVPRLLRADLSAWPGLATGLRAHLARFPDARGVSGVEEELLRILVRGEVPFHELFVAWQQTALGEACGFGDLQIALAVREMRPLVMIEGGDALTNLRRWRVSAPEDALGRGLPLRERWIGGCHLARGDEFVREGDAIRRR